MICLASYPRSGNTFLRNVLYEVYGIESASVPAEPEQAGRDLLDFKVAKTHLREQHLPAALKNCPTVYLIRDGRDALVSMAHQRKDILEPGTDFYNNLLEAILAQEGSFFGGWSTHVREWSQRADLIIHFADLIENPLREAEKLRAIIDLPPPDAAKLPTFQRLKFGQPQYGVAAGETFDPTAGYKAFRRGKVGSWKDEMPPELEKICWEIHGAELTRWGFEPSSLPPKTPLKKVVIEGSKFYGRDNDGVKRYLVQLVAGLKVILPHLPEWQVFIYDQKAIEPLLLPPVAGNNSDEGIDTANSFRTFDEKEAILTDRRTMDYEKRLLLIKTAIKNQLPESLYRTLAEFYRLGPFRNLLNEIKLTVRSWKYRVKGDELAVGLSNADLIHLPLPQHFTELGSNTTPLVVTVHDLTHRLFPEFHSPENTALAERGMQAVLASKAHLLAVSESTRQDIEATYELPPERVHLVYEAADLGHFRPRNRKEDITVLRKRYQLPNEPYLMCLSVIEPRKNLQNTIRAFLQLKTEHPELDAKLVICGKHGWKTKDVFAGLDLDHPDLVFTGFVDDADLPLLYAHARALCYLSFYEGFGLPILEAMACKTPVIFADNSSLPEVAGPGGLSVNAHDLPGIQQAMHSLLTNDELWQQTAELAWQHANKFSWLKTALQTLEVYDKIITSQDLMTSK